ncbi:MAG: hypothetical protein K0S76_2419 [Herbinix sp.]|jgi:hypothetical protein|nr:hypothetical protein [Herbinix sp.]
MCYPTSVATTKCNICSNDYYSSACSHITNKYITVLHVNPIKVILIIVIYVVMIIMGLYVIIQPVRFMAEQFVKLILVWYVIYAYISIRYVHIQQELFMEVL